VKVTGVRPDPNDGLDYETVDDFDAFCTWHRPRLEQWYMRRGLSPEDAADVAQEAFAGLAGRWKKLATDEHRRRSYYTITKNKLADFHRKQARRIQPDLSLNDDSQVELVADPAITDPAVIFAGANEPLWAAIEDLPEQRREAVLGRFVERMSFEELVVATGRTESALRKDVTRALLWLRRTLKIGAAVLTASYVRLRRLKMESVRAACASASATAMTVIPQAALLSLLVTAPLYALHDRAEFTDTAGELTRMVVLTVPRPVRDAVVGLVTSAMPGRARRPSRQALRIAPRVLPRAGVVDVAVPDPPSVCLKTRCGTGERITVNVLGTEHALPGQSYVETCWAVPSQAEPTVTCSEGTDPP
jgi:RNA polymerase sigma factor (sigma-70 family)